ncbi:MAG: redoxin domain-containing protein [Acidiferrobacterales bacterium]|nr:redoxin domain-containing protein [Acidiferrobacterales bacterium]
MKLKLPCDAIDFTTRDIYGRPFQLSGLSGKRVMLSFFRDAACPYCNFRLYELTHQHKEWKKSGLEIVAVFSSPADEVREFVARHPRPFRMLSDPDLSIYHQYGIEQSFSALFRALIFKGPRIVKGVAKGGRPRPNPHVKIVPADFLLDNHGRVVDIWYGRDTADHIPLERIQSFINAFPIQSLQDAEMQIKELKKENAQLRKALLKLGKRKLIDPSTSEKASDSC